MDKHGIHFTAQAVDLTVVEKNLGVGVEAGITNNRGDGGKGLSMDRSRLSVLII